MVAPRNLCDACADAITAWVVRATSLATPVLPVVVTTTAIESGANEDLTGPKASAGPLPSRVEVIFAIISARGSSEPTRLTFRCDFISIAVVGYR